jgi:hypothetical protein
MVIGTSTPKVIPCSLLPRLYMDIPADASAQLKLYTYDYIQNISEIQNVSNVTYVNLTYPNISEIMNVYLDSTEISYSDYDGVGGIIYFDTPINGTLRISYNYIVHMDTDPFKTVSISSQSTNRKLIMPIIFQEYAQLNDTGTQICLAIYASSYAITVDILR